MEESAASAYVGFPKILDAVHDGGANSESNTIVIGLADASNGGHVGALKDVLSRIYTSIDKAGRESPERTHLRCPFL